MNYKALDRFYIIASAILRPLGFAAKMRFELLPGDEGRLRQTEESRVRLTEFIIFRASF